MCGIVGWLDTRSGTPITRSAVVLNRMRDSISRRGPDDYGSWIGYSGQVALANRRLSIVDLSPLAHQPMRSESVEVLLSYNGEVYNHLQIRSELEGRGYRFKSRSDTETVLYAFQEWGIDCLDRLKGQFAFAVWDGRTQTLYLVRDRVGLQPLYFYANDGLLAFGSELRALLQHPAVPAEINEGALYQYYILHTPSPPYTLLKGVYSVPAGSYVSCRLGETPKLLRYWSLFDEIGKHDLAGSNQADISAAVRDALLQSVQRRLMSDRPVGLFLSGGLDSASVLACMSKVGAASLDCFSIGYEDESSLQTSDEFGFARIAGEAFDTNHTLLRSQPSRLHEFIHGCDMPPENLAEFWLWEIAEMASARGMRVMLHGEGSDELFFGYNFHWQVLAERERVRSAPGEALNSPIDSGIPADRWAASPGDSHLGDLLFWGGGVHPLYEYQRNRFFAPGIAQGHMGTGGNLDTSGYRPIHRTPAVLGFVESCYTESGSATRHLDYR